jgi:N-acetylmuramoyl-L-alanine amidase
MPLPIRKPCAEENFRRGRPSHLRIDAIVIHLIDGTQESADITFRDPLLEKKRSAHYSIGHSGEIHQYVDEQDTAFHCGVVHKPTWSGLKRGSNGALINPNFYTIGIEHEGRPDDEWPEAMYKASADLIKEIAGRHPALNPLTRSNVIMHREIRADKSCPGNRVDLMRLIAAGGGTVQEGELLVHARSAVNVRHGHPSRSARIVRVVPAGEPLLVKGQVTGESVNGVSLWYQNMDDDYIWAGAVTAGV